MRLRNKKTGEVGKLRESKSVEEAFFVAFDDKRKYYDSLAELNEDWEDYKQKEEKPKRYRLKKDLPTFKAGDEFFTDPYGSLWLDQEIDGEPNSSRVMAYNHSTLEKFPNILENWFEPIEPPEPLIKDEKIRKAVRAWAEANDIIKAFIVMNEHMNWTVYGDDIVRNRFSMEFFGRVVSENNETAQYTIAELCGEEEE